MSLMLPRYVEEKFDDIELTEIFKAAEERDAKRKEAEEFRLMKEEEHEHLLRNFLRLKHKLLICTKESDEATENMLMVSEGKMTSKLPMSELIKNFKDNCVIVKNVTGMLEQCKNELKKCKEELYNCKEYLKTF
jgi:hypothetical protein